MRSRFGQFAPVVPGAPHGRARRPAERTMRYLPFPSSRPRHPFLPSPLLPSLACRIGKRTLAQHQRALLGARDDARHSELALSGTLVHFAVGGLLEICLCFSSEGSQRPSREHASCSLAQKSSARDCVDPERIGRRDQENSHEGPAQHDGGAAGSKIGNNFAHHRRRAASVTLPETT